MKKLTLYLILAVFTLSTLLYFTNRRLAKVKDDRDRVKANQQTLISEIERAKNQEASTSISVQRLLLTHRELKTANADLVEKFEKQGLKLKRLEAVGETKIITQIKIKEVFRDSIVNVVDTVRCLKMINPFAHIDICDMPGANNLIEIPIKIEQAIHRVPRKFLFIKYGTKGVKQDVFSNNPYALIEYSRYIELK